MLESTLGVLIGSTQKDHHANQNLLQSTFSRKQSTQQNEQTQSNFDSLLKHLKRVNTQSNIKIHSSFKKKEIVPVVKQESGYVQEVERRVAMPSMVATQVEKVYGSYIHNTNHQLVKFLTKNNSTYQALQNQQVKFQEQQRGNGKQFLRRNIAEQSRLLMSRYNLDLSSEENACVISDLPALVKIQSPRSSQKPQTNMVLPNHIQVLSDFLKSIRDQFTVKFVREQVLLQKTVFNGVYQNDQAKFNGMSIDQNTKDIYIGSFSEGRKTQIHFQL